MLPPCCSPQDYFRPITGLPISTYFSAYKYLWLYENVDAVREAVDAGNACIGTIDSWLVWCLTGVGSNAGVHITDGGCAMCVWEGGGWVEEVWHVGVWEAYHGWGIVCV